MEPGEWLGTQNELAALFNVSRVTIRDAVGALSARGLVNVPRGGPGGGESRAQRSGADAADTFSIQMELLGLSRAELLDALQAIKPNERTALAAQAGDRGATWTSG